MISIIDAVNSCVNARILAQAVLAEHFFGKQVVYPINPFQMLTDGGVPFVFRAFNDKSIEGMYLSAQGSDDTPVVGINIKRPITRQRFTAAHELCHHIKDCKNSCVCNENPSSDIEKYAEKFAAELLMPYTEMKRQISLHEVNGNITFDGVLDFFA